MHCGVYPRFWYDVGTGAGSATLKMWRTALSGNSLKRGAQEIPAPKWILRQFERCAAAGVSEVAPVTCSVALGYLASVRPGHRCVDVKCVVRHSK